MGFLSLLYLSDWRLGCRFCNDYDLLLLLFSCIPMIHLSMAADTADPAVIVMGILCRMVVTEVSPSWQRELCDHEDKTLPFP